MQVFLNVPYEDRRLAKMNGAHWSKAAKRWYILDRISFVQCKRWVPRITQEIKDWLESPELIRDYGKVEEIPTRWIRSTEQQRRHQGKEQRARIYNQYRKNTLGPRKADRSPANTPSGSSIKVSSVTVKLPL